MGVGTRDGHHFRYFDSSQRDPICRSFFSVHQMPRTAINDNWELERKGDSAPRLVEPNRSHRHRSHVRSSNLLQASLGLSWVGGCRICESVVSTTDVEGDKSNYRISAEWTSLHLESPTVTGHMAASNVRLCLCESVEAPLPLRHRWRRSVRRPYFWRSSRGRIPATLDLPWYVVGVSAYW